MEKREPRPSYISTVLSCKCPRCRLGKLFKNPVSVRLKKNMAMHEHCPVCAQPTEIEVGFYYGTGYVSYLLALVITVIYFLLWLLTIGFSFEDNRFIIWIVSNSVFLILLQPWLMRFSRALWLSFFVSYDADWQHTIPNSPERVNKEQQNNW